VFCFHIQELHTTTHLNDFINHLNEYIPEYVLSKHAIATHEERINQGITRKSVIEKAREFLQITKADRVYDSGEFGEFLLHLFATKVIGAHKLTSKMQARGSRRHTIPGRDNVYAWQAETGEIFMLIGEAKTKPSPNDCLREAQRDLNNFWATDKITHEIHLASTHIREEMTVDNGRLYEAYFIDDNPAREQLGFKNIIFIGYSNQAISDLRAKAITIDIFCQQLCSEIQRCLTNQQQIINESKHEALYCFLPFESIDDARNIFAQTNNLIDH
jgi:hypothetical protein